jgi:hypothetical protein
VYDLSAWKLLDLVRIGHDEECNAVRVYDANALARPFGDFVDVIAGVHPLRLCDHVARLSFISPRFFTRHFLQVE